MAFRGTYDYSLDAKNRLTIPPRFRADLSGGVVLARGMQRNVGVWVPDVYEALIERALEGLNPMSPDAQRVGVWFSANSYDTELDAAGRVMLPTALLKHAGLKKEVVVIGAGESLQVWDRGTWSDFNSELTGEIPGITARLGHPA